MSVFPLKLFLCAQLLLLVPSFALAQLFSEPEKNWVEEEVVFPPPPQAESLREFYVTASSPNTFLIDESSLNVGADGVVRFILVIRTRGGAESVSFEGIRCTTSERRIYAHGRPDGEWVAAKRATWERLRASTYNMPHAVLAVQHFCDGKIAPRSRAAALHGLRHGLRQ